MINNILALCSNISFLPSFRRFRYICIRACLFASFDSTPCITVIVVISFFFVVFVRRCSLFRPLRTTCFPHGLVLPLRG